MTKLDSLKTVLWATLLGVLDTQQYSFSVAWNFTQQQQYLRENNPFHLSTSSGYKDTPVVAHDIFIFLQLIGKFNAK